jgi:sulfhydrogenase subunit beta (sulfur reductase)
MKQLAKTDLPGVLKDWAKNCTVICPSVKPQGDIIFDTFDENTFTLDYGKPSLPPKSFFLPHSEVIFELVDGRYEEKNSASKTIIFGIRACDMTGLVQSQSFMTRDNTDPYYQARIDTTITVVMACGGPQNATCFCTTTRSGPASVGGFDLQFYDMGKSFLVETGSDTGAGLVSAKVFADVKEKETLSLIAEFCNKATEAIPEVKDIRDAMAELTAGSDCTQVWNNLGNKCIICGGCAFVCPTCTCFNVYDQAMDNANGVRIKAWDACLYNGFTREASGHNPRPTQSSRLQRRHEHKLLYFNATDVGGALCGCVGCGRCSDYCPVHIGTLEVAHAIVQAQLNRTGGKNE